MSAPQPGEPAPFAAVRVARNTGVTVAAEVLSKLFVLVYFALVARLLGDAVLGDWVTAAAIVSVIWSVAVLGLDRMAMRDMARDPGSIGELVVPMVSMKVLVGLGAMGATIGVLALAGSSGRLLALLVILGLGMAIGLAASTAQTVFAAGERMELFFLTKVPWSLATSFTGIAVVLAGGGIVLATAVSTLAVSVVGIVWCSRLVIRNFGAFSWAPRVRAWPGMLRRAVPFTLQDLLGQIIFRFDIVLLAVIAGSAVVGAYGAAFRMLEATLFLAWSIGFAVTPMYSYLGGETQHELERVYEGSLKLALTVMAPIAAVLLVLAEPIVDLVYGLPEYEGTVPVLRLLAPAIAMYALGHLAGTLVLVRRRGRVTVIFAAAVAALNVVACLVLIPRLEAEGAAIATLVCELVLASVGLWLARRAVPGARLGWALLTPLVAAAAMGLAMLPLERSLWLALPAGGLVYLAALALLEGRRLRADVALFRTIAAQRPTAAAPVEL
jgi:O-antigen/teichoic acid export membrane protein